MNTKKIKLNTKTTLLHGIYINKITNSIKEISLELNGMSYFNLDELQIKKCYKENINLLEFWGFYESLPINGTINVKYEDTFEENIFKYDMKDDKLHMDFDVKYDFKFYDMRINKFNTLRIYNGIYGIMYSV